MRYPNSQSRGSRTAMKTKEQSFFFSTLGELPQLFSQPAEQRAACTGLSPQQHTPHPPDWPCHTTVRQNPPQLSTIRPGLQTATLTLTPDFPRLTITLGGWWGCFLQITQPRWLSGPQQHPQPHSFSHSKPVYSSASFPWHKIDRLHVLFCF